MSNLLLLLLLCVLVFVVSATTNVDRNDMASLMKDEAPDEWGRSVIEALNNCSYEIHEEKQQQQQNPISSYTGEWATSVIEALTADPMELNISTNPPSQLQQIDQIMLQVNETLNNVDLESPSVLQGTKKRKSLVKRITKLFSKSKSNMKRAGNNTMRAISRWSTRLKPAIVSLFGRALNNPRARSRMQNALDSPEIREAWNAFGLEIEQFRELQEAFDHDNDDSKAIQQSDQHISTVSSPSTSTLSFNSLLSSSSSVINDGSVGSSSDISDTSFHTALSKRDGTGGGSRKSLHDHIQGFKEMLQRNQKTIKIIAGVTAVALLVWCILSLIPLAGIIVIALAMALFAIVLYWK